MGFVALMVFLGSLAAGFLSLFALVWSGINIYRTLRYAQSDSRPWVKLFTDYGRDLQEALKMMENRARNINLIGLEMRERVDDIRDVLEELGHHPFTAAFRLPDRQPR